MSSVDFLADLGPSVDVRAVAKVLSAAAAPPWPHELRGYESARRAFENAGNAANAGQAGAAAGVGKTTSAGATPVRHSYAMPLRRLLGVKLAAVAGALTVTGVAVAAEADVLPSPIQRAAHQVLGSVGVPDPDPTGRGGQSIASASDSSSGQSASSNSVSSNGASGGHSSGGGTGGVLPGTPTGTADTVGTPGQSPTTASAADVLALCRAYTAHPGDGGSGNADNGGLSDNDRRRLAALAGGADKIDAFCAQVLTAASTGGPVVPQPSGGSAAPSAPPDPSHDHKPSTSPSAPSSSGSAAWGPATSDPGDTTGANGHSHTSPSHTGH